MGRPEDVSFGLPQAQIPLVAHPKAIESVFGTTIFAVMESLSGHEPVVTERIGIGIRTLGRAGVGFGVGFKGRTPSFGWPRVGPLSSVQLAHRVVGCAVMKGIRIEHIRKRSEVFR
jgi:hypothetical protein